MTVTDACKQVFEKIKTKKDFRYVVFFIKDEKFIDVETTGIVKFFLLTCSYCWFLATLKGSRDASYDSFLEHLKIVGDNGEQECRYGLFDFEYTHQCQGTHEVSLAFYLPFQTWTDTDDLLSLAL